MEFWDTFWATMWGALAGAIVAALAAWLFSLDLRRREREDRAQEREQDRLDRIAERDLDREARLVERSEQRDWDYDERIRQEWPRVIEVVRNFGNASRAIYDALRTSASTGSGFEQYRDASVAITQRLFEVATFARGADYNVINSIGRLTAATPSYSSVQVESMDRVIDLLAVYAATSPDRKPAALAKLDSSLKDLVTTAEQETKDFLSEEGVS